MSIVPTYPEINKLERKYKLEEHKWNLWKNDPMDLSKYWLGFYHTWALTTGRKYWLYGPIVWVEPKT